MLQNRLMSALEEIPQVHWRFAVAYLSRLNGTFRNIMRKVVGVLKIVLQKSGANHIMEVVRCMFHMD